jgi:hypothetical protein
MLVFSVVSAACSTGGPYSPLGSSASVNPDTGEVRSQPALELQPNTALSAETLGAAGALAILGHPVNALGLPGTVFSPANSALLYVLYDPLAPNWSIKEQALDEATYRLALRAKSFRTGGDGEAFQIIKRRALHLQRARGYSGYRILDYSEGIESSTPLTHRVSEGTIELVTAPLPSRR